MPTYTVQTLVTLAQSPNVGSPEFKWSDWESVFRSRRRSSAAARPEPKAKVIEFDEEDMNDPDKAMAAFFLRQGPRKPASSGSASQAPAAPVSAPTAAPEDDSAIEEDDGWTAVNTKQRKRGMSRGSFSKWK